MKKGQWSRWIPLYVITGIIDVAQFLIDWTGIGIGVSEFLELAVPPIIMAYFLALKIPLFSNIQRLTALAAGLGLDAITAGAAPFWILDVWYLHRTVRKEDAVLEAKQASTAGDQLNSGGRREPTRRQSLNVDGVRAAS